MPFASSTLRGLRIALYLRTDNAKPTPNINNLSCYSLVKVRVRAYAYTQNAYQNRHKRDNLYPVGHLSLLSLKIPESCEVSKCQNRALINAFLICLLPSANDVRHPSAQVHGAKLQHFFETCKHIHTKIVIYVPKHK